MTKDIAKVVCIALFVVLAASCTRGLPRKADRHLNERNTQSGSVDSAKYSSRDLGNTADKVWPDPVYSQSAILKEQVYSIEHIQQHLSEALRLADHEGVTCVNFTKLTRALCPLAQNVIHFRTIGDGIRVTFSDDVNLQAVIEHMRCHHAYGHKNKFKDMNTSPLYLKKVEFSLNSAGLAVEIVSNDANTVTDIIETALKRMLS